MPQRNYLVGYGECWVGLKLTSDAETMYTALGFTLDAGFSGASSANEVWSAMAEALAPVLSVDWSVINGFVLIGNETDASAPVPLPASRFDVTLPPVVGELSNVPGTVPQNTAVLVRKSVGFGRPGLMYIPGVQEGGVNPNGSLTIPTLVAWQAALTTLEVDVLALTFVDTLAVASMSVPPPTGGTNGTWESKIVTGLAVQDVVATQRRRLRR